jgi:hypothetical protein
MYFESAEVQQFLHLLKSHGPEPFVLRRPFSKPMVGSRELVKTLLTWADRARQGKAGAIDLRKVDKGALPGAGDETFEQCTSRLQEIWGPDDWFAYINDVQQYNGDLWERAIEIISPLMKQAGGMPAGGFKMELFFGRYGATPTGIHLDTSDNLAFVLKGPKRMIFWPRSTFSSLLQIPSASDPSHEQALTRHYQEHMSNALTLDAEEGDVVFWSRDYWHVGASPDAWTAMIAIPMWWAARPATIAGIIMSQVLRDLTGDAQPHSFDPDEFRRGSFKPPVLPPTFRDVAVSVPKAVSSRFEMAAQLVFARLATACGFTVPPGPAQIASIGLKSKIVVKHPIIAMPAPAGHMLIACGHCVTTGFERLEELLSKLRVGSRHVVEELCGQTSEHVATLALIRQLAECRALGIEGDK